MATIQMEEFLVDYPSVDLPDIQNRLTFKKEFIELASSKVEAFPESGGLFKSQELFLRIMTAYDRVLNIAETGTGKTCSVVSVAEYYDAHREHIKHVYVLQKPSTIQDFKNQILCKCTGTKYQTDIVKNANRDSTRKSNVTREIGKWYTILSYQDFATRIKNSHYSDPEIIDKYSGCIFVVDEAHNLRNSDDKKSDKQNISETYNTIHHVFQIIKRSKIMISTATPMINEVREIPRIANLALPPDRQMDLNWDYSKITMEQLELFLRGHVFFVRALDTGAVSEYQGQIVTSADRYIQVPDPEFKISPEQLLAEGKTRLIEPRLINKQFPSQAKVFPTQMGRVQNAVYRQLMHAPGVEIKEEDEADDIAGSGGFVKERFHLNKRQVACFVYPDGTYGGKFSRKGGNTNGGIGKYVESKGENDYEMKSEFKTYLADLNNMATLSGKYASIVNTEMTNSGCGFCYVDYVYGSGAIMLGMCFEAQGFTRFDERSSVFIASGIERRSVCPTSDSNRKIKSIFDKRPRYALLTSDTPNTIIDAMLELFNSKENANGEYIKVIIVSPVARDGINIFNVVRGHLVTPGWHPSGMHQALSRFMRADSHISIIKMYKEYYLSIGRNEEPRVPVKIYIHTAFSPDADIPQTIDLNLVLHSELKNIMIHRIMRMLKQIDIGCRINYERNVRPAIYDANNQYLSGDIDGSEQCDYDICRYTCSTCNVLPTEEQIDYTTYDAKYADIVVKKVCKDIIDLIKIQGTVTFDKLKELWIGKYREKFIYMAIDYLLTDKQMIIDRYGLGCYIHTDGYNIYTQREFPTGSTVAHSDQELSIYGEQLIAVKNTVFEKIVNIRQQPNQEAIINKIINLPSIVTNDEKLAYDGLLEKLVTTFKVMLLESAIINYISDRGYIPYVNTTVERFKAYIYHTFEPWEDLIYASEMLSSGKKFSKAPSANKTLIKSKYAFKGEPAEGSIDNQGRKVERVYFHTLYSANIDRTEYAVTANYRNAHGRIRVYKKSFPKQEFRDTDDSENLVYGEMAQFKIRAIMDYYQQFKYYGEFNQTNNTFRIGMGSNYHPEGAGQGSSFSNKYTGKVCRFWEMEYLYDILVHERIEIPSVAQVGNNLIANNREDLIRSLQRLSKIYPNNMGMLVYLDDAQLNLLYRWHNANMSKDMICPMIYKHFLATNKIHFM